MKKGFDFPLLVSKIYHIEVVYLRHIIVIKVLHVVPFVYLLL